MRDPSSKAAIFAGLAASGAATSWLSVQWYDVVPEWVSGLMFTVGFTTVLIMLVLFVQALFHARGKAKLEAGAGRVAQWHVSADEWDKYRAADGARAASDPTFLGNDLWIRKATPPGGVEIIVGEKALIVDNSYHVLRMNGLPELRSIGWLDNSATAGRPADCLEFLLAYPRGRYGGIKYTTLRVPVPEEALEQGRLAYHQFAPALERRRARGPIALRNPRRTLQVCGVILALSFALAARGWVEAERVGWNLYNSLTPLFLLLGGGAGAFFAVFLGGLTLLLRPKDAD